MSIGLLAGLGIGVGTSAAQIATAPTYTDWKRGVDYTHALSKEDVASARAWAERMFEMEKAYSTEMSNTPVDRCIAVPSEPHFIFDSYFDLKCVRPMPTYSVPGYIDHF